LEAIRAEDDVLAVDDALGRLADDDAEAAALVKLRFFGGLTSEQAAEALGGSPPTPPPIWRYARAFLLKDLKNPPGCAAAEEVGRRFPFFLALPAAGIRTGGETPGRPRPPGRRPMSERDIFDAALAIDDPAQRAAYLDRACAGQPGLREHLDALLSMDAQVRSFLEAPAPVVTVDELPITEGPGTVIGPYRLLEQVGEGGFGVVFLAEQTQPVRRKVALKVLKPGMDTRQVVARFRAERQPPALTDHPHIAKVFDGGTTSSGRPYFGMELVKGVPITQFCDQNQLTPRQRLELFVPVCQAVQHAHQKGIIHRDLKPSNVLVSRHD